MGQKRGGLTTTMFIKLSKSGKGLTLSVVREVAGSFPRYHFCNTQAVKDLIEGKRDKAVPVMMSVGRSRQDREDEVEEAVETLVEE